MSSVSRSTRTVTILNGGTVSSGIDLSEMVLVGMQLPTVTGVSFTFQGSHDGVTYGPVKKIDGTAYTVAAVTSDLVVIPPADLSGIRFLKVVSGGAEGAERVIVLLVRNV